MGRQFSDNGDNIHVFDSKSASAGEIVIVLKLREYIEQGLKKIDIIAKMERFINEMKTYFAIENVDNLKKNGRLNKVVATIITKMHISPIMGADGDGNIALFFTRTREQTDYIKNGRQRNPKRKTHRGRTHGYYPL